MATDEDMQASLDGGTAGSLVFSARLTGSEAPQGCYGNRLIICRGAVGYHGNMGAKSSISPRDAGN